MAIEDQARLLSRAVQVAPPSSEVYIWPLTTVAASLEPSADEAIEVQKRLTVPRAVTVQLVPPSAVV